MSRAVTYTDYFILMTGGTTRQTKALAESVRETLAAGGRKPVRTEGQRAAEWILLDYLDVVVHIFTPEARDFYRLERLWGDVPFLAVAEDDEPERVSARLAAGSDAARAEEESA